MEAVVTAVVAAAGAPVDLAVLALLLSEPFRQRHRTERGVSLKFGLLAERQRIAAGL